MEVKLFKLSAAHAPLIGDMARAFKEEATFWKDATLSVGWMEDFFRQAAEAKHMICYSALDLEKGRMVGFAKAHVDHTYFGPDLVCYDLTVYVMPEYRGFGFGARMARLVKKSLDENGVKHVVICNTTGIEPEQYARMAEKIFGLKPTGQVYK